jgi:hypothetical protein
MKSRNCVSRLPSNKPKGAQDSNEQATQRILESKEAKTCSTPADELYKLFEVTRHAELMYGTEQFRIEKAKTNI